MLSHFFKRFAFTVAGISLGAVSAFFLTYYTCIYLETSHSNAPAGGHVTVGIIYLILTVPLGGVIGGGFGFWSSFKVEHYKR